jgi:predicted nuclease of predicted toxin-antitoxin system
LKFLLDNNLSPHLAKSLDALSRIEDISVEHLREKFKPNTPDEDWISKLSIEGGWTVITYDHKIRVELRAWKESNLILVFLPSRFANLDFWNQAWRITKIWPEIIKKTKRARTGTGFKLNVNCTKLEKIE